MGLDFYPRADVAIIYFPYLHWLLTYCTSVIFESTNNVAETSGTGF